MQIRHIRSALIFFLTSLLISTLFMPAFAQDGPGTGTDETSDTAADTTAEETPETGVADPTLAAIDIETVGKDTYYEGEYFDPSLYVIRATYSDGTTKLVKPGEFEYAPTGRLITDGSSEDVTVEFSYGGKTKKTYVTVKRPIESRIITLPARLQYNEGSSFVPDGLMIELVYADGTSRLPDEDEIHVDLPAALTPDITSAVVECYGTKATLYGITVIKMVSMMIIQKPDKIYYYEGERFDPTGMMIIATFENSSQGRLLDPSEYTVSGSVDALTPDSSDRSHATITFTVGSISQTLELTVYGIESFRITPPTKTDYYYGDKFDRSGFAVKAVYVNGAERDITDEVTLNAPDTMAAGSEVRMQYLGYEETVVSVHEVRVLHIKTLPTRMSFKEGEQLTTETLAGMLITAEYDDGTEVPLSSSDYTISPTAPLTITDTRLTVTYLGLSASAGITVLPARAISRIEITKAPAVTQYISNQPLDIIGMVVTAVYEDGTRETIPYDQLKITPAPGTPVKVTDTHIKVVYQLSDQLVYSARQEIEVSPKKVISLSILTPPSKLTYVEGEKFDTTGMVILAVYNDGTSAQITTYTCSPSEALTIATDNAEETISITISYVDCTATQNITVKQREITSIEVAQNPAKLEYSPGEKFDPTGLMLKITYANGESALIENAASLVTFDPDGELTLGVSSITLTFRGKTLVLPITVREIIDIPVTSTDDTEPASPVTSDDTTAPTSQPSVTTADPGHITTPSGFDTIMVVWIAIIAVIVILLVVLILYYKRNFT